ncbi:MAG TPA: DsbA family oxidoreductase [Azonexus sp.]
MLTIDIVADIVCPWCFIGKRRLETAIAALRCEQPAVVVTTCWRPFFLNPDTPPEGEPYLPFLERKFGSRAAVEALFERVRAGGRPYGVDFAFERIPSRANTLLAHRLIHWAQQRRNADALVERLFVAQFQHGEAVGDPATLRRIATECGYPADEWAQQMASGEDAVAVRADERRLRALGIAMVPTFIVDHARVVVGAEDPAVLVAAMRAALAR